MEAKNNTPSISLVIPVYNNQQTIKEELTKCIEVLQSLTKKWEIVIGNDASSDQSKHTLVPFSIHPNIRVFHHKKNKGIAKNLRFLYSAARFDLIGLYSIDGDWDLEDVKKMYVKLVKENADVVVGKRLNKHYSLKRKIISNSYRHLPSLLFGVDVIDPGSLKIFKRTLYKSTSLQSQSVFFEAELIIKTKKNKLKVLSVPISHLRHNTKNATGGNMRYIIPSLIDLIKLRIIGLQ